MLPTHLLNQIETDYRMTTPDVTYLSQGSNGAVYLLTFSNGEKICVKSIAKGNATAKRDFELYEAVYRHLFNFKWYDTIDDTYHYFTIPFFPGVTLEQIMSTQTLALDVRLRIFKKLIEAMQAMHRCGIIHRDLKAANVLVDLKNNTDEVAVNIIDFGRGVMLYNEKGALPVFCEDLALPSHTNLFFQLARKWQPQTAPELSSTYGTLGTWFNFFWPTAPLPEQMVGFRSDYYALGTLFQALMPEHAALAADLVSAEGSDRNHAFYEFCVTIDKMLEMQRLNQLTQDDTATQSHGLHAVQ